MERFSAIHSMVLVCRLEVWLQRHQQGGGLGI